ncbi:STAS domain-containing protein [Nocardioides sp. Kera G14]|uniref:STAS domain-containing protein n=1 Tax=Nocardioides sp. Kera G14 TaxID=2884264 RepID=UPI001D110A93|nr:STAS domain-containing protein [Nocardioides sp. Kera G14]UDY25232.1 STAS domain-containing protein [Nocardioides sp. Kera G14]
MDSPDTGLTATVGQDPDGTPVVALSGELDLTTSPIATRAFEALPSPEALARENGAPRVVVDVTHLRFMDSSGITVFLTATRRGYHVRLRQPNDFLRSVIAATGLAATLPPEDP